MAFTAALISRLSQLVEQERPNVRLSMSQVVSCAMSVNSSSRSRTEATSRPISASVSNASASRRLLIETGIGERDGDVGAELGHDRHVSRREVVASLAEDIERTDGPRLVDQRDDDLGVHAGHELDVARVGGEVVDEQRLLGDHRRLAAPHRDACARRARPPDTQSSTGSQLGTLLVEEINRKGLEVDEAADQLWNLLEQVVKVENGSDLPTKIEERRDQVVV